MVDKNHSFSELLSQNIVLFLISFGHNHVSKKFIINLFFQPFCEVYIIVVSVCFHDRKSHIV